jgi:rod shape-determining protein MreC
MVDGRRADVLLITDPRSAVDVVLEQSRARGVAVGTGEADRYAARLQYLQRDVKAVEGERVLTTGDDGRYPRGLMVGEVRRTGIEDTGPFQRAEAVPVVDLNALDEVFVVLGPTGLSADGGRFEGGEKRGGKPKKTDGGRKGQGR